MTPAAVLDYARAQGCALEHVGDDRILLTGPKDARAQVAKLVRAHKAEVLALLQRDHDALAATDDGTCDDCGKPATVLIVTDYGCRYCRRCLRPSPLATKPRTKGLS